jgi:hypothetical protein
MHELVERIGDDRIIAPETRQHFRVAGIVRDGLVDHGLAGHDEARQLRTAMLGVLRWEVNEGCMPTKMGEETG